VNGEREIDERETIFVTHVALASWWSCRALGDLIKTPSRKKGTTAKKTRAKAAADKDKVNKLAALNKKNASDDQPVSFNPPPSLPLFLHLQQDVPC
jgi:hypothetical protein